MSYQNWAKIDPLIDPFVDTIILPKHEPGKFKDYVELLDEADNVIGFKIGDVQYLFDQNNG